MFVPLILANHGSITGEMTQMLSLNFQETELISHFLLLFLELEIGTCSNQLLNIICHNLKHLTRLAILGEDITYSGVVGLG